MSAVLVPRRDPALVMRLARLGSLHQSRLSFMRILTRRLQRERWFFDRSVFEIDRDGVGHAVYTARGPKHTYSLVAFAHDIPARKRSDRVIADVWDSTFVLFDGIPSEQDIQRLSRNVPLQEGGRLTQSELSLSRANRSVRLWEHVVSALAAGEQPDRGEVDSVGYLMRTTAVYGSGKFGAADRETVADRAEFAAPFQVEMLNVYLIRAYVRDLVEAMAASRGGRQAVKLDVDIARSIGIGNSTGLGMAPFILNHPVLFNNWIMAREEAIARVRNVPHASADEIACFREFLARSIVSVTRWHTEHPVQQLKVAELQEDLERLDARVGADGLTNEHPWHRLYQWAENTLSLEGQECLASLMLEPYGDLVDELADGMAADRLAGSRIEGRMSVGQLRRLVELHYDWALDLDWAAREHCARAWYVSAEKLEPRMGERFEEPVEPFEQPLAPARDAVRLHAVLKCWSDDALVAEFLLHQPEHRHTALRIQVIERAPYAEVHDNTISASVSPVDMLRAKLGFFGAIHFDPRSDRWVRICMYANAPYPEELIDGDADTWPYPASG